MVELEAEFLGMDMGGLGAEREPLGLGLAATYGGGVPGLRATDSRTGCICRGPPGHPPPWPAPMG